MRVNSSPIRALARWVDGPEEVGQADRDQLALLWRAVGRCGDPPPPEAWQYPRLALEAVDLGLRYSLPCDWPRRQAAHKALARLGRAVLRGAEIRPLVIRTVASVGLLDPWGGVDGEALPLLRGWGGPEVPEAPVVRGGDTPQAWALAGVVVYLLQEVATWEGVEVERLLRDLPYAVLDRKALQAFHRLQEAWPNVPAPLHRFPHLFTFHQALGVVLALLPRGVVHLPSLGQVLHHVGLQGVVVPPVALAFRPPEGAGGGEGYVGAFHLALLELAAWLSMRAERRLVASCRWCGKVFYPRRQGHEYCSASCRVMASRARSGHAPGREGAEDPEEPLLRQEVQE